MPRALGYKGTLHGQPLRKILRVDRSPLNGKVRVYGLECGHDMYATIYSVSSLGNVRNEKRPDYMLHQPVMSKTGYVGVRLWKDNKGRTGMIATLVTAAFIGPRPDGQFINHKDGNKHNNSAANLEYVTKRQNEDHAVENALHAWGEKHGMRKLTNEAVWFIRANPQMTTSELGAKFHVSKGCIQSVRSGATWRHLV